MVVVGETTISSLISTRSQELRLTAVEIVCRCGFRNISRGLRRLEQLRKGDFESSKALIKALPNALQVTPVTVEEAIIASERQLHAEQEAAWRLAFIPHAIILCERERPQPLFVASFIGVDRLLRIDFAPGSTPVTFAGQALEGVRAKLKEWKSEGLPAFGRPIGVVVNYSPDTAVSFDLSGHPLRAFNRARRIGDADISIAGRAISQAELQRVIPF